jgi:hypothetical protein
MQVFSPADIAEALWQQDSAENETIIRYIWLNLQEINITVTVNLFKVIDKLMGLNYWIT